MHTLRLIHRWIGILIALPIVLVSISGGLLVLRDPYYRTRWPAVAQPATAAEYATQPRILERIEQQFGDSLRTIKFPREGVNAFHVYLTGEREGLVDPRSGDVLATWHWSEDPAAFLFQLHAHLLAGATGEVVNGYLAVILVFLSLSGLALWVPRRGGAFRLRHAVPGSLAPASLLKAHAASGVLLLAPIAFFATTGAGLVFYEQIGAVAAAVFDDRPAATPSATVAPRPEARADWTRLLAAARTALPESGPRMCYPGRGQNVVFTCRTSLPGEWHPNGRSYVLIDPYSAQVLQTIDARQQGAGTRAMHALYPLHAARTGGLALAILAIATAFGLGWLALGGAWTFLVRKATTRPSGRRETQPLLRNDAIAGARADTAVAAVDLD